MMLFPFFSVTFLSLLCPKYITVCLHVGGGKVKVYLIIRSDYVDQDLVFIRGNVQQLVQELLWIRDFFPQKKNVKVEENVSDYYSFT